MSDPCQRATEVSVIDFLSDPEGTQWSDFRAHATQCPVCTEEIEGWRELEDSLRSLAEVDVGTHPSAKEFVGYRRHRESLSEDQRARITEHLAQCAECQEENSFVDSFDFSRLDGLRRQEARTGEAHGVVAALVDSIAASWIESKNAAKERVYVLRSRIVAELRQTVAVFTELPIGFTSRPYGGYAEATRTVVAETPAVHIEVPGESVPVPLGDSGLTVELAVGRQATGRLLLTVSVEGEEHGPLAVSLSEVFGPESRLVAAQSSKRHEPLIIEGLSPGDYSLEVWEIEAACRFQIPLHVGGPTATAQP